MVQDEIVMVRVAYAENIAVLAETALRFLEMVQLDHNASQGGEANGGSEPCTVPGQVIRSKVNAFNMYESFAIVILKYYLLKFHEILNEIDFETRSNQVKTSLFLNS